LPPARQTSRAPTALTLDVFGGIHLRFRFEGKRPKHAPLLREGTRSTPQCNHKDGAGPGAPGEFASSRARQLHNTGRRPHGRSRPGAALRRGGGAADGSRDPQSRGRLGLQTTGGFMLHAPTGKPAAGRRYFFPARQPRQLITREAAAHGLVPSRRTPPQARGGFGAPAGQLNARMGQPQKE
jgi:hypothetical protein